MATTLESLLSDILNAVYGKDVRQSIHDAIEQCYADATGNPDSVAKLANDLASYSQRLEETRTLIQQVNDALTTQETTLYAGNGSTAKNASIALGNDVNYYDYLDIYVNFYGLGGVQRVNVPNPSDEFNRVLRFSNYDDSAGGSDGIAGYTALELYLTIKNKTVTVANSIYTSWNGGANYDGKSSINLDDDANRRIVKIIGIKKYRGTSSGGMNPQSKTVSPTFLSQSVLPDDGYNCLSQVTVNAIPVYKTDNDNGTTVTIG